MSIILEDNIYTYFQSKEYLKYINGNLAIGVLVFFLSYFILQLLNIKYKSYERFTLIDTPNINSLDNESSIKISINNIQNIFTNNTFFGSKYKSDNFMLLLDDIAYDYINIQSICDINKFRSFTLNSEDLITSESKRNALNNHLIESISFIPDNITSIRNEINNIIHLLFNEYLYNCS